MFLKCVLNFLYFQKLTVKKNGDICFKKLDFWSCYVSKFRPSKSKELFRLYYNVLIKNKLYHQEKNFFSACS